MTNKPLVDWPKIAALIREARGSDTQPAFGARIGLSQTQVSDLERQATRKLTPELQRAIEKALGTTVPRLALVDVPDPDDDDAPELVRAIALLRRLYRNRGRREHDWKVIMVVLEAQGGPAAEKKPTKKRV